MGCGASVISQAEFDQVRREAEEAKTKVKELEQLVAELKAGQSRDGTAVAETATDVAELQARLESQLRDARREIKELQSQLPTTQSSGNGNGSAVKPSSSVGGFTDEPPAYESTGPKVGDKVISHWVKWQFYPATIHSFDPDSLTFTVDFDDGDTTGREQKVEHVAVNKIPDVTDVGVGSIVFFPQGRYAGSGDRQGGTHWHLGKIVHVSTSRSGEHLYSGEHVKGEADGKWVTYKGYNRTFENLPLSSLRVSPNVFDLLQQHQPTNTEEKPVYTGEWPDVFISFSHANCSSSSGADNAPPAYSQMESVTTDPRRIKDDLRARGFSCWDADDTPDNGAPEQIALAMRNCKVVVACISNEYAADSSCRTQFQFAKKMLKKPVVPIIVGAGAWDWQATVVGLLIAGELFISFQDQGLHERKMEELIDAVSDLAHMSVMADAGGVDTPARNVNPNKRDAYDVFVSYCWNNSITAESEHNITRIVGNLFNDPRHIKKELTSRGYSMWLDVEQIEASGSGLFEDITQGLTASNCVLAFISQEYAMSDNCRLEFQFALKSLHKPVIPVVVGNGEGWQQTAIGFLSSPLDPIFMVSVEDETSFYSFLSQISARLEPHKVCFEMWRTAVCCMYFVFVLAYDRASESAMYVACAYVCCASHCFSVCWLLWHFALLTGVLMCMSCFYALVSWKEAVRLLPFPLSNTSTLEYLRLELRSYHIGKNGNFTPQPSRRLTNQTELLPLRGMMETRRVLFSRSTLWLLIAYLLKMKLVLVRSSSSNRVVMWQQTHVPLAITGTWVLLTVFIRMQAA
eukprot:m.16378 g.16378  ORF g.16378 m.16378 type:complete len:801 (-) comp7072_c0_seq1:398-2800(-)